VTTAPSTPGRPATGTSTTVLAPGTILDFLRSRATGPAGQDDLRPVQELEDLHDADLDAELLDRLQEMYVSALPGRLAAISRGTRDGDAPAVASAADTLAGTSGQLGHPEVASICQAIARDARQGVLAHARLVQLTALTRR
jgi:Hpt domain-containing protein